MLERRRGERSQTAIFRVGTSGECPPSKQTRLMASLTLGWEEEEYGPTRSSPSRRMNAAEAGAADVLSLQSSSVPPG